MGRRRVSRRALTRGSLARAGGALVAGNATVSMASRRPAFPVADATPAGRRALALDLRGGDAWTWEKRLTGTYPGCPRDATISLRVNGEEVAAERDGDAFATIARLQPGENEVVAVMTRPDGRQKTLEPVVHTVRLTPRPTARIGVGVAADNLVFDGSASEPSGYDESPIRRFVWSAERNNPSPLVLRGNVSDAATPVVAGADVEAQRVTVSGFGRDGEYTLSLRVVDDAGREDVARTAFVVERGIARPIDPVRERSGWIADAAVYGGITWAFGNDGFRSVTSRLDDLRDLGITALWFAPITRTPPGLFGYEVIDFFDVREEYGTKEDFRELVREAHARGIRVVMDFVPNHTAIEHPYYRDAERHGRASPYFDFYDRDEGGNYTYYFDWLHLPNLNYANPEVRRFMLEAFSYWVRELDVDGFRVDAVWGIREREPAWLAELLAEMNRIKPDSLLIAEASARDPFYAETGFDAAYDWTEELGDWAWDDALGDVAPIGQAMTAVLTNEEGGGYHPRSLVFRFLNNNDTGARFLTTYGLDFYRVSLAMLLTLPGLPCLYTGDEVGAEFLPYGTIAPIDWADHFGLRPYVKRLIALRRTHPSLHSPHWRPLAIEPAAPIFGFLRYAGGDAAPVLVLLNFSGTDLTARLSPPPS